MQKYTFDEFVKIFPGVYKKQIGLRNKTAEVIIDLDKPRTTLSHLRVMATMSDHMVEAIENSMVSENINRREAQTGGRDG